MTDRTVSFRILSNAHPLPEPPATVPQPTVHWRDGYFDAADDDIVNSNNAASRNTSTLTSSAAVSEDDRRLFSELGDVEIRRELWKTKALLDTIPEPIYYKARNETFPLAVGGAQGSSTFYNRAGHKLNEVMEVTGIWNQFIRGAGQVVAPKEGGGTANDGNNHGAATERSTNNNPDAVSNGSTSTSAADGDDAAIPMPRRGGSNTLNAKGRTAFIDLCGGPGSFAQAIFGAFPRKSKVKLVGFGMTLKDPNMADKHNTAADGWYPNLVENKNFHPTFGVNGEGDIYKMSNIRSIVSVTCGMPMLLAVADGGFEVPSADANWQETISMRLAYCQWHAALCTLQKGGSFVLKLFDTFSPIMRSMLYLTTKFFDSTFIVKPKHSRAVNSERYLAAKGFRGIPSHAWRVYLERVHDGAFSSDAMPATLVPASWMLKDDSAFEPSMVAMNKAVATNQIEALKKVMRHASVVKFLAGSSSSSGAEESTIDVIAGKDEEGEKKTETAIIGGKRQREEDAESAAMGDRNAAEAVEGEGTGGAGMAGIEFAAAGGDDATAGSGAGEMFTFV